MTMVGYALEKMDVMDAEKFMKRFAVTIVDPIFDNKFTWIPWIPGIPSKYFSLLTQVCCLGHETDHSVEGESLEYGPKYLTDKSYRAHKEYHAEIVYMSLYHYLTGRTVNTKLRIKSFENYNLRKSDLRVMKRKLDLINVQIKRGYHVSTIAKVVIRWLNRKLK